MARRRTRTPTDERGPSTLGDLLYADDATHPAETVWVELVQSIAAGDQRGLHALYERAHRIVFTLILRITGNPETAEEVTLDVFHDVWRRAASYDAANGPVLGWILNQARSRAIDRLRFEHRKKRVDPQHGVMQASPAIDDPHETLQSGEQARALREALGALKPDERQALEIAYFSGLTYAEVAERLNQPLGTIKTRVRSALATLRHLLAKEGSR